MCVGQVKTVLLNVIQTSNHINTRPACFSGHFYGFESAPWRVLRRQICGIGVGGKPEYAVRPSEYVNLHRSSLQYEAKQ